MAIKCEISWNNLRLRDNINAMKELDVKLLSPTNGMNLLMIENQKWEKYGDEIILYGDDKCGGVGP